MVLSNIKFPEEDPFYRIKVRQILLCFFLLAIGIGFQIRIISSMMGFKIEGENPILERLGNIIAIILTIVWLLRQCRLLGINIKQLIGNVSSNYLWLPVVGLVIARVLFSRGIFLISYYPLSFWLPSFVENILNYNINHNSFIVASKTFLPALYYILSAIYILIVTPLFDTFFRGIALHRWTAKWGIRKALLALCIFYGVCGYQNIIGVISFGLIYTLLYIKTNTLIVPTIAFMLDSAIYELLDLLLRLLNPTKTASVLEQFRSEWRIGVFFLVLSAPWVIRFIYKNWPSSNKPLPYFANTSQ